MNMQHKFALNFGPQLIQLAFHDERWDVVVRVVSATRTDQPQAYAIGRKHSIVRCLGPDGVAAAPFIFSIPANQTFDLYYFN